jgi:hypothetical protein
MLPLNALILFFYHTKFESYISFYLNYISINRKHKILINTTYAFSNILNEIKYKNKLKNSSKTQKYLEKEKY